MKTRCWMASLLAAFVALAASTAHAIRTPMPDPSAAIGEPSIPSVAPLDAGLEIVSIEPIGYAQDGDCLDLVCLAERGTHNAVFCIVKSPLGLEDKPTSRFFEVYDDAIAGLHAELLAEWQGENPGEEVSRWRNWRLKTSARNQVIAMVHAELLALQKQIAEDAISERDIAIWRRIARQRAWGQAWCQANVDLGGGTDPSEHLFMRIVTGTPPAIGPAAGGKSTLQALRQINRIRKAHKLRLLVKTSIGMKATALGRFWQAIKQKFARGPKTGDLPIHAQKQAGHVPGTPQNINRIKQGKTTSSFFGEKSGEAWTQKAWREGVPTKDPNIKILKTKVSVGTGPKGGMQKQIRVVRDSQGRIHGTLWGPEH